MADARKRNWAFVVYPESAPEDWREKLREMLVPGYISPLHDSDVNPDGEVKKAHWHVILTFKGNKSYEQIKEITDSIHATAPQVCKDVRAYARYLCHLDNPEKAQYEVSDVECLCGADYLDKIKSAADTDTALGEMMDWCMEQGCFSFFRLSNYARRYRSDWFRVITSSRTVFLTAWLKSMEWEARLTGCAVFDTEEEPHADGEMDNERVDIHTPSTRQTHDPHGKYCPECGSDDVVKNGKTPAGSRRYLCRECGKSFT